VTRPDTLSRYLVVVFLLLAGFWGVAAPVSAQGQTLEQRGIVQPEQYLSPQFANEVTWSDEWEVDADALESDSNLLLDRLSLTYKDEGTFQIIFIEAAGELPDDYARRLVRYRGVVNSEADVVWSSSEKNVNTILYAFEVDGETVYSVIEIRLVNRSQTLQVTEFLVYPDYAESLFDLMQDDIVVDGSEPFHYFEAFPTEKFEAEVG
jgi:hypothetical protein